MSTLLKISSLLILIGTITACENFSFLPKDSKELNKEGKEISTGIRKTYRNNGKLYSEVSVKNGVKNGLSKSYHDDGSLYLALNYLDGEKDSTSTMYYRHGSIKRTTEYNRGNKHGKRISYFKNGNLSSESYYNEDRPAIGLVEYYTSGNKIKHPELKVDIQDHTKINGKYSIEVYFEGKPKNAEFFIGELRDAKYLDTNVLESIPGNGKVGTLAGQLPYGNFIMKKIPIVGKMKTKKGNILIKTMNYNLAVGG